jgi:hypothetical protein
VNRISGGKVLARGTRHVLNRAATALRLGASTLLKSQTYLGAQYRRLRTRLGAPKAITAMAHRLARLVYRMLKYGQQYVDKAKDATRKLEIYLAGEWGHFGDSWHKFGACSGDASQLTV